MPTFSSNYQIKLIGTGEEAGTWGTSTNENLKRIEQALGTASQINIASPPAGSSWSAPTLTFQTSDTVDAYADGSQGRSAVLSFYGNPSGNANVQFRGNGSSDLVDRVYIIQNNLDSTYTLTLNNNSSLSTNTITIQNGCYAVVGLFTGSTVSGGLTNNSVSNLLSKLQIDDLLFPAAADITLVNSSATALEIKSTASNSEFLRFDTSHNHLEVAPGSGVNTVEIQAATVDASLQSTKIEVTNGSTTALQVSQSSDDFITIDTSNEKVIVGQTLDIDTAEVNAATQATDIVLKTNDAAALEVYETSSSGTKMLTMDTNTPKVIVPVELEVTGTLDVDGTSNFSATATFSSVDINGGTIDGTNVGAASPGYGRFNVLIGTGTSSALHLSDAGAYASFGTTAGLSGHGIRENSGTLNVKNTNSDDWGQPYHTGMVNGEGSYFEVTFDLDDSANLAANSADHSFSAVPRILRCVLICEATDNGYAVGDEIELSSLASSDTGNNNDSSGGTYGANSSKVFYALAGTLRAFPKTGYASGDNNPSAMTKGNWNLKIMAWK